MEMTRVLLHLPNACSGTFFCIYGGNTADPTIPLTHPPNLWPGELRSVSQFSGSCQKIHRQAAKEVGTTESRDSCPFSLLFVRPSILSDLRGRC